MWSTCESRGFFLTLVRSASLNWSERIPRFIVLVNFSKELKLYLVKKSFRELPMAEFFFE